jgi:hypothetical protein
MGDYSCCSNTAALQATNRFAPFRIVNSMRTLQYTTRLRLTVPHAILLDRTHLITPLAFTLRQHQQVILRVISCCPAQVAESSDLGNCSIRKVNISHLPERAHLEIRTTEQLWSRLACWWGCICSSIMAHLCVPCSCMANVDQCAPYRFKCSADHTMGHGYVEGDSRFSRPKAFDA